MKQVVAVCIVCAVLVLGPAAAASGAPCDSLASLSVPNTTVTLAQTVAQGAFTQPGGRPSNAFASMPGFCRVAVTLTPTPRSDIKAEVWLPSSGWNGKLQVVGNGS